MEGTVLVYLPYICFLIVEKEEEKGILEKLREQGKIMCFVRHV